jgi:hypothetical protein
MIHANGVPHEQDAPRVVEPGLTIAEAAKKLGLTVEAVRHRIRRGSLKAYKDADRWYIVLADDAAGAGQAANGGREQAAGGVAGDAAGQVANDHDAGQVAVYRELVESLRSEVEFLRAESVRKDHIIAQLAQRVPQLSPPTEERHSSVSVPSVDVATTPRRWWQFWKS